MESLGDSYEANRSMARLFKRSTYAASTIGISKDRFYIYVLNGSPYLELQYSNNDRFCRGGRHQNRYYKFLIIGL